MKLASSSMTTKSIQDHKATIQSEKISNLFGYDRIALEEFFSSLDEPSFRAQQVLRWIYHHRVTDIDQMTDLSLPLRRQIKDRLSFDLPCIKEDQKSRDGTRKWLLELSDGNAIETVLIPEKTRLTLCVSSQAGCPLGCTFCATARQGFARNLSTAEIVSQLWLANERLMDDKGGQGKVTNVVMMGMGEPLLSYAPVVSAMWLILDDLSFGLSRRCLTLSTAGLVPGIDRLAEDCPVSLAVSLHATDDELRDRLVPLNKKYPISTLLDACRRYSHRNSRGQITFEYIMLNGVNDSEGNALKLAELLDGLPAKVNLIPYNNVADTRFKRSPECAIEKFRNILMRAGIMTITRKTRGQDIDAACGQLVGRVLKRNSRIGSFVVDDDVSV